MTQIVEGRMVLRRSDILRVLRKIKISAKGDTVVREAEPTALKDEAHLKGEDS